MKTIKETLHDIYLDYFNNYLTVDKFATDNNLSPMQAVKLIRLGQEIDLEYRMTKTA